MNSPFDWGRFLSKKSLPKSVVLNSIDQAFTQGGNRLCFVHPDDKNLCIKIPRPDRTPRLRRQQKSFPKNLKPLSSFDENKNERKEINRIQKSIGGSAFMLIARCFGEVETDLGKGLCLEMVRDDNGKVSLSLKQYLWVKGMTPTLKRALEAFCFQWQMLGMPSRDLLLHNIVVQQDGDDVKRLVVIDGLGWAGFACFYRWFPFFARRRAKRKIDKLRAAIVDLNVKKDRNADWGYHGWLDESQRVR